MNYDRNVKSWQVLYEIELSLYHPFETSMALLAKIGSYLVIAIVLRILEGKPCQVSDYKLR